MLNIEVATTNAQFEIAKYLFEQYQINLNINLCFQNFNEELASLSTMYYQPQGALLLAKIDNDYVGCVGVRRLDKDTAEMKRMFVLPQFRGFGVGRQLAVQSIKSAAMLGYKSLKLDTIPRLKTAINLYTTLGFMPTDSYCHNPEKTAIFMEKIL